MTANSQKYVALDNFHHNGTTYGPKSAPFSLIDHDAKFLLETGQIKPVKTRGAPKAEETDGKPGTITSASVKKETPVTVKSVKGAPDNKKRDLKAANK